MLFCRQLLDEISRKLKTLLASPLFYYPLSQALYTPLKCMGDDFNDDDFI